jgi:Na+/proline symporter
MLVSFIVLYLLASIAIGLLAARRVHNTADYAVAGRTLPLAVSSPPPSPPGSAPRRCWARRRASSRRAGRHGGRPVRRRAVPGAGGRVLRAQALRDGHLTIGDYYRRRFGRTVEVLCSAIIIFSYLGWVGAQVTALGLVFNLLSSGAIPLAWGMVIGTLIVLVYTLYGGMWSVALTDFVQMIVITVGLVLIAWFAGDWRAAPAR